MDLNDLALELGIYLEDMPHIFPEVVEHLGVDEHDARRALTHHRRNLSDERYAIVTVYNNIGPPLYVASHDPQQIRRYVWQRIRDVESRSKTNVAITGSAVAMTKPETPEGLKARILQRSCARLIEDLELLAMQVDLVT